MPADKLSKTKIAQIHRLINDGLPYRAIARSAGVSLATVSKYANSGEIVIANTNGLPDNYRELHEGFTEMQDSIGEHDLEGRRRLHKVAMMLFEHGYLPGYDPLPYLVCLIPYAGCMDNRDEIASIYADLKRAKQ